jgi:hypothetical protein
MSTCPKCDSHYFEVKENEPRDSNFKLLFVQCGSCGAVIGVMDYLNIGAVLQRQNRAIEKIASQVGVQVRLD